MRICVICAMVASALLASIAQADPPQRSLPIVDSLDLDDFETNLKADPQFLLLLQAQDRDHAEALIRAGQKQRPASRLWAADVQELFAGDQFAGKRLQGAERTAHFKHALVYLQESHDAAVEALKKAPDKPLREVLQGLQVNLALAALEAGETGLARKHAEDSLLNNQDRKSSQFGNIIHDANQILGRCALREGKLADAKTYLLKAGATPGSPQLNSFGPQMQLARELVEKGEKEAVLQYLDLVSLFWAPEQEPAEPNQPLEPLIAGWRREIAEGRVPTGAQWR